MSQTLLKRLLKDDGRGGFTVKIGKTTYRIVEVCVDCYLDHACKTKQTQK